LQNQARRRNMKKIACAVLVFTMIIFLVNPLSGNARVGYWGGGYWGWWAPWAVIGGAAVLAPYYYSPYYAPYYVPQPVVIQEQPRMYIQSAPSVPGTSAERIFVYPRKGQNEELQAKDRYECHLWGVKQTGYDPTGPTGGMPETKLKQMRADYNRAMSACLDGRGYSVK